MKRAAFFTGWAVLAIASPNGAADQDALARMRAALGGDTALSRVQTIRARGTIANKPLKNHFDIAVAFPDRFVKIVRSFEHQDASWVTDWAYIPGTWQPRMEPALVGGEISDYERVTGFNGDGPIPRGTAVASLDSIRAKLAEFLLPLLGATPFQYEIKPASEGNAVVFRADGREWRIELDNVTQLPARMSWSNTVTTFSDYRMVGTLRWPHRLITTIDGKRVEDAAVTRYDVNAKLSEKMFQK